MGMIITTERTFLWYTIRLTKWGTSVPTIFENRIYNQNSSYCLWTWMEMDIWFRTVFSSANSWEDCKQKEAFSVSLFSLFPDFSFFNVDYLLFRYWLILINKWLINYMRCSRRTSSCRRTLNSKGHLQRTRKREFLFILAAIQCEFNKKPPESNVAVTFAFA